MNYIAPSIWMLVTLDDAGEMVPSPYVEAAIEAGLEIIAWSLEPSGPLEGRGWYFQSVTDAVDGDDRAGRAGAGRRHRGHVSDWPATVTFYANCMDL